MHLYLASSFNPDIQAAELADPSTVFLIAEVDGQPVGYARLRQGGSPAAIRAAHPIEIARFYSRRRWIGRRVGAALMQECLGEAHARGCDVIWLDVWERNDRAIAFYHKWGFAEDSPQPFHLGNDIQKDLLMARPVWLHAAV
ncbi:MAG: GNAT family N-acetyltransferase, partial [Anaerolineales bacterium]